VFVTLAKERREPHEEFVTVGLRWEWAEQLAGQGDIGRFKCMKRMPMNCVGIDFERLARRYAAECVEGRNGDIAVLTDCCELR
jgi:hypothetical protein